MDLIIRNAFVAAAPRHDWSAGLSRYGPTTWLSAMVLWSTDLIS
jgi:hypothetical protein